jgi:RNA polymerase sigma-70 factor (ECF subfamily)
MASMSALANSTETNRLLGDIDHDAAAWPALFARHRERLRRMVRLRLDRRVPARYTSSAVLDEVSRAASGRWHEYRAAPTLPFFLWLRSVAGERLAAIHHMHLSRAWRDSGEICLNCGVMPHVNTQSLAAQLLAPARPGAPAPRADLQRLLQDVLNQMDPLDREVLALCHFEELKNDEAALVLGVDRGETSRRYVQAVKALKEILQRIPGFFNDIG